MQLARPGVGAGAGRGAAAAAVQRGRSGGNQPSAAPRRLLDQIADRFGKLQDSLGEKVLPGLLLAAQEPVAPEATFIEKLQRLERLGAVPSAADWKLLRALRNALAHDYPDAPALQAAWLNRLVASIPVLLGMAAAASVFADRLRPPA